mmetsp:Transcript_75115/g.213644  ORF Transcript_75115/g.213644 Transcript_75115/m.213644 type:complete len:333 (+) Transcript_75115:332-1330(+)
MSIMMWMVMAELYLAPVDIRRLKKAIIIGVRLGWRKESFAVDPVSWDFIPPRWWWRCTPPYHSLHEVVGQDRVWYTALVTFLRDVKSACHIRQAVPHGARVEAEGESAMASVVECLGFALTKAGELLKGLSSSQIYRLKHDYENKQSVEDALKSNAKPPCSLGTLRWLCNLLVFTHILSTMYAIILNRILTELTKRENKNMIVLARQTGGTIYVYVDGIEGGRLVCNVFEVCAGNADEAAVVKAVTRVLQLVIMEGRLSCVTECELADGARGLLRGTESVEHAVGLRFELVLGEVDGVHETFVTVAEQQLRYWHWRGEIEAAYPRWWGGSER